MLLRPKKNQQHFTTQLRKGMLTLSPSSFRTVPPWTTQIRFTTCCTRRIVWLARKIGCNFSRTRAYSTISGAREFTTSCGTRTRSEISTCVHGCPLCLVVLAPGATHVDRVNTDTGRREFTCYRTYRHRAFCVSAVLWEKSRLAYYSVTIMHADAAMYPFLKLRLTRFASKLLYISLLKPFKLLKFIEVDILEVVVININQPHSMQFIKTTCFLNTTNN